MQQKISLGETNYVPWAVQMKLVLQQQCLWSIVDGRTSATQFDNSVAWEDKRDQALATILLEMNSRIQAKYIEHTDPVKLWTTLETDLKEASHERHEASAHERREGGRTARAPTSEPPGPPNPEVCVDFPEDVITSLRRFDWILSTESSSNFAASKQIFKTYAAYPEKKTITTNKGQTHEAVGYGETTLRIHGQEGGDHKPIMVTAYHVPTLKCNVLSPQQLGYTVDLDDEKWTIKNEDGTVIATAQVHAGGAHVVRARERGFGGRGNRRGGGGGFRRGGRGGPGAGGEEGSGAASGGGASLTAA